jgi:DHA1 family tetracycline resistance protein-like MFS transporter
MSDAGSSGTGGPPPWRRAVILVTAVSLLNSMAAMIVVPVLPKLVQSFTGDAGHAAEYVGLFAATFALVQFFASPVLGSLSDAFGRRTVILISAFGLAADYSFMALAPSVGWLFVGRIVSGVTAASAPAVNAYIADTIPPEERAAAFGWTGSAFAVGFLLGPALGGLVGAIDPRLPFWISAGLCLATAAYGLFVLPESLPKARRTPFAFRRANPWGAVRFLVERPQIRGLAATQGIMAMAAQCLPTTLVLYTFQRFGWSTAVSGPYLTYAGIGHLVVQSMVVKRMVGTFGERTAAAVGFASTAIGFVIYASAPIGLVFAAGMPFYALAGLVGPAVQSQMTRLVAPTEQGRLQGTNASIASLVALFAPVMFTQLFKYASGPGQGIVPPGLHLYVGAAVLASGALLALATMRPKGVVLAPPEQPAEARAAGRVAAG